MDEVGDVGVDTCDRLREEAEKEYHHADDSVREFQDPFHKQHDLLLVAFADDVADEGAAG